MDFTNKTVCITGAATGIGRGCAHEFAKMGARLILMDINSEKLENVKTELKEFPVLTYVCDVTDEVKVNACIQDAKSKFGTIDILVNNAALWRSFQSFMETDVDTWKQFLDVNVMSAVYLTRACLPDMLDKKYGKIINVASVAGVYGNANMVHYSATKGALIAMTKGLAKEVADKGITVNCVSPGSVSPAENPDLDYTEPSELAFMNRTGSDRENANLICFLASDEASYISAQNIQIDGCRRKQ